MDYCINKSRDRPNLNKSLECAKKQGFCGLWMKARKQGGGFL